MEAKGLIIGLVFTLGVFAIKGGAGFGYLLSDKSSLRLGIVSLTLYLLFIGLIFWGTQKVANNGLLASSQESFSFLAEQGMRIHFLMWAGLMAWGTYLLTRPPARSTRAWLILSAPCPVCLMVIVIDVYLFTSLWPKDPIRSLCLPFLFFSGMVIVTSILTALFFKRADTTPKRRLGWIMVFLSAYFATNVLTAPHFKEAKMVYEMAIRQKALYSTQDFNILFLFFFLFIAGILRQRAVSRRD
ncbi:hypothetical protein DBT_1078 [Dissulfuribacter thermophilus]|uniref:Uncharacterized protein n=1 Tax=Dissulfuribacter thermophilus TaxID=1156395 RepID=A0A1B9F6D4_9BACT|nr:DUF2162 family putative transporter [Dissulfuribacter thermophilus]OCC15331.1 hypothetical protein DBT_1078 [Dissulfuribacter thermophilus]